MITSITRTSRDPVQTSGLCGLSQTETHISTDADADADTGTDLSHLALADLALLSIQSAHTRRAYKAAIMSFLSTGLTISRSSVLSWLNTLESTRGLSAVSLNIHLAGIRKLVDEAHSRGFIDQLTLNAIHSIRTRKVTGTRLGNWTDVPGIKTMILAVQQDTHHARNQALIALMFGCGLRRSELCSLKWSQFVYREGRWVLADVLGKGKRTRTIPVPSWAADYIHTWKGK